MGDENTTTDPGRLARIERELAEYLLAADAGAAPDPAAWLAAHAELQPELGELLAAEGGLQRLADPLRPVPGRATQPEGPTRGAGAHHAEPLRTVVEDPDATTPLPRPDTDPGVRTGHTDGG